MEQLRTLSTHTHKYMYIYMYLRVCVLNVRNSSIFVQLGGVGIISFCVHIIEDQLLEICK